VERTARRRRHRRRVVVVAADGVRFEGGVFHNDCSVFGVDGVDVIRTVVDASGCVVDASWVGDSHLEDQQNQYGMVSDDWTRHKVAVRLRQIQVVRDKAGAVEDTAQARHAVHRHFEAVGVTVGAGRAGVCGVALGTKVSNDRPLCGILVYSTAIRHMSTLPSTNSTTVRTDLEQERSSLASSQY